MIFIPLHLVAYVNPCPFVFINSFHYAAASCVDDAQDLTLMFIETLALLALGEKRIVPTRSIDLLNKNTELHHEIFAFR